MHVFISRIWRVVGILALCAAGLARADDLSTTNLDRLRPFWIKSTQPNRPVTVLSVGDSVANSYNSITSVTMYNLSASLGTAGFALNNFRGGLLWYSTNDTVFVQPSKFWFTSHFQLPPGGGVWWENLVSPVGLVADRVGIFYVSQPQGGNFTLSISTNGAPWQPALTLNGFSATPAGHYTNLSLPLNSYRIRVDGVTGTNYLVGPQLVNSHSNGLQAAFMDEPGISLYNVTNVASAIRDPIFQGLAPDLLIWHMKEDGTEDTRQRMMLCERDWSNSIPGSCVLYIGTPYVQLDQTTNWTPAQNAVVRGIATNFGRAYVDCMTPAVSYDWMQANGYMQDGTHPSYPGNLYLAGIAWANLGFYALRTPLNLSVQRTAGGVTLQHQTVTNIFYAIQSSTDLFHWQTVVMNAGRGQTVTTNLPAGGGQSWFRLSLSAY